ncbi:MAG: hypothetical protein Q9196_001666 [Gyalolechia fulgens]
MVDCDSSIVHDPVIFSDNQAALETTKNPGNSSEQLYLKACVDLIDKFRDGGTTVHLQQCPGHKGIRAHEQVDLAAKGSVRAKGQTAWLTAAAKNDETQHQGRIQAPLVWRGRRNDKTPGAYLLLAAAEQKESLAQLAAY